MDESLFTTRQLTKYVEWSKDKKGCIFFVEERSAICFIEGEWRELDEMGEYDKLHKWELENIQEEDVIVEGFPALLLSRGVLTSEDEEFVHTAWDYYLQENDKYLYCIPESNILTSLFWVSVHWDNCNRDKLSFCFDRRTRYYLNKYLCSIMQDELGKIMEHKEGLMLWTHSMFQFIKENNIYLCEYTISDFNIHRYLGKKPAYEDLVQINAPMSGVLAHGFQAAYINYQIAYHNIGQILANTSDMNIMARKMLHGFSEYCLPMNHLSGCPQFVTDTKTIPLARQQSFKYPIDDFSRLCDAYIQIWLYRSRTEEAKDSVIYTLFNNEVDNCRTTEWLSQVFNQEQVNDIITHTMDFLVYYLQKLQNTTNYEMCKKHLIETFPSLKDITRKEQLESNNQIKNRQQPLSPLQDTKLAKAIMAVYSAGICTKSDWAAVVKIMEERRLVQKAAYSSDETLINNICGETVTDKDSIARSICMSKVKGVYPDWVIRNGEETRETPNKLNHYKEIAEIFTKALDA